MSLDTAKRIWAGTTALEGTGGEQYLSDRGFAPPYPETLRFHPACPYVHGRKSGVEPAIIAKITNFNGKTTGLHKLFYAKPEAVDPAPDDLMLCEDHIRLSMPDKKLALAVGLESGLAVERKFKLPTWAMLEYQALESFRYDGGLSELVIFSDYDEDFRCLAAAYHLANRVHSHFPNIAYVNVYHPHQLGTWADEWRR